MKRLRTVGGSLTIPCKGSLIVPSGNIDTLPLVNEFTQDTRRLTTAQSPFGGVYGLVSYSPGSVHVTEGDGIYLTDVVGANTSKDLPAGLLSRLGYLTVDPVAHTITEEFIVSNTNTSNNPTVIDSCDSATGWGLAAGAGTISAESGRIKVVGTSDGSGLLLLSKTISVNLSTYSFIGFSVQSSVAGGSRLRIQSATPYKIWQGAARFIMSANTNTIFVYPIDAPQGTTGQLPGTVSGTLNKSAITIIGVGVVIAPNTACTYYIDNIFADTYKSAYIEISTPDNLADTSLVSQKWNGSAYETNRTVKLDTVAVVVSSDTTKMVLGDQTKFDDVYGTGLGRSNFPKEVAGQTVSGTLAGSSMTYSANKGTSKRIGIRVDLPPSDGGRTAFNTCRFKTIIYYSTNSVGKRAATYEFSNDNNASTGLLNIAKPWLAIIDPVTKFIDYYLFTERPTSLSYKKDETGNVYEVVVNPGNGLVYKGSTVWANSTLDTNSDSKPDMLDATVQNTLAQMLAVHGFNR